MSKKISVIIPVYNVEKYLRRCVDSVIAQTYENLEVILVDDGSPDGCPQICDEYANKDSRIRVIHKKNGGLSSARNAALDSGLTGDYVTFVDSDDWIAKDYYKHGIELIEKTGADVLQVDYAIASDEIVSKEDPSVEKVEVLEGKDILQYYLTTTTTTGSYSVWRCLFSLNLIGNIRFRDGKINEDIDWKYKVLKRTKKFAVTNRVMCFYYQSGDSISSGGLKKRDFQLREAAEILCDLTADETYGTIAFLGRVKKARTAFSLLSKIAYFGIADSTINKNEIVRELTAEHRKNVWVLLKSPISISRKMLVVLFAINFSLTEWLIHTAKHFVTYI